MPYTVAPRRRTVAKKPQKRPSLLPQKAKPKNIPRKLGPTVRPAPAPGTVPQWRAAPTAQANFTAAPAQHVQFGQAPPTAEGATIRANADTNVNTARTGYRDSIFRAAMRLGSPEIIAALRADPQFAGYNLSEDPNSTFSDLARQETKGLGDIDVGSNAGNTFFSGLRLNDRGNFSQDVNLQRGRAVGDYQDALSTYAAALAQAESDWRDQYFSADQADLAAALAAEPQDLSGGDGGGGDGGGGGGESPELAALRGSVDRYKQGVRHHRQVAAAKKKAKKKKGFDSSG